MKKRALLFVALLTLLVCTFALTVSATTYYYDANDTAEPKTPMFQCEYDSDDVSTQVITSYNGSFPKTDSDGDAITWYAIDTQTEENGDISITVKSFKTMDAKYYGMGSDGIYRYLRSDESTLDELGEVLPTKHNVVSVNFPNDCGIKRFSDWSNYGLCARTGDYYPNNTELLFVYFPNSFTDSTRIVQATTVLEVYFDKDTNLGENLNNTAFYDCRCLRKVVMPDTIKTIDGGPGAFHNCKNLTEFPFSETCQLTTIGSMAFDSCTGFVSIKLPNSVTTLAERAFQSCTSLVEFRFGANLVSTETISTFLFDKALKYVYIPKTVTSFCQYTFPNQGGNVTGSSAMVFFYTGTQEDFAKITLGGNNQRLTSAVMVDWGYDLEGNLLENPTEDYYKNLSTTNNKIYLVCGFNLCDAFYNDHAIDEDSIESQWLGQKYVSEFKVSCICANGCGKESVVKELAPLFKSNGFASNASAMMQSFAVNKALIEAYKPYLGDIKFGLVAAYCGTGTGFDTTSGVLVNADGTGVNSKVAIVDFTDRAYDIFEMKIAGIGENHKNTEFYICAYVIENGAVSYINNNTTASTATAVKYADVAAFVDDYGFITTVPAGTEEE